MTSLLLAIIVSALPAPTLSPSPGEYASEQLITVSIRKTGAPIYCTTDGSVPRRSAAQRYTAPLPIATTTTVKCISSRPWARSRVVSGTYTITGEQQPLAACATEPLRSTGTTYYYCDCGAGATAGCVAGNNANDGLSASTPKQTGWKSRFTTMAAGDTVALCRGGSLTTDAFNMRNANCTAGSTCDLRDYTPAAHPEWANDQSKRPILVGDRIGYFPDNGSHYEGFRFFNVASSGSTNGQGVFYIAGDMTDGDICNVHIHDGVLGVYFADPNSGNPISKRWTLRNSQFERLTSQGVLGGCTDCTVDSNYFANDSFGASTYFDHPLYISAASGYRIDRMKVTNNEVHACRPGTTTGTIMLVVHGEHEDLLIENNLLQCDNPSGVTPNQWGIGLNNGGYPTNVTQSYARVIIRGNRIVGQVGFGIEVSQSPDAVIENNVIIMSSVAGSSAGIHLGEYAQRGASLDALNTRVTIRNNTVHFPYAETGWEQYGIMVGTEGVGHIVTNNVVYYAGGLTQCFYFPLSAGSYSMLSNNACNGTWGTTLDANRFAFTGSPFVGSGDYRLAAGSALVNAGTTATTCTVKGAAGSPCYSPTTPGSITWDPAATAGTRSPPVDIGAYER